MKIYVITHGLLAKGLVDSASLIVGEQDKIEYFSLTQDVDINDFKENIENKVISNQEEIICFTDIVNGSPFNIVSELTMKYSNIYHISGVNLPMILEALLSTSTVNKELIEKISNAGTSSIFDARLFLKEKLNEEY